MTAYAYTVAKLKQRQWALNHDIPLVGSKGKKGELAYTAQLDQNLFAPLDPAVRKAFMQGDGNEITAHGAVPAKMQAVHSSCALCVNVFHYWHTIGQLSAIAAACGFCRANSQAPQRLVFEEKYPILDDGIAPNIDVVFHNADTSPYTRFAVECKFVEPYVSHPHGGLKPKYLQQPIWQDVPALHELAQTLCPADRQFTHLHAAQLVKHILGLKAEIGKGGFRLLYLWCDAYGAEGARHRQEIEQFAALALADGIKFHALTYQDLILRLTAKYRQAHGAYIKYLTERYL